jgi:sugar phosphate isomerase/epimerase
MIKFAVMTFMYNGWCNGEDGSHAELIRIIGESAAEGIEAFANNFMGNGELVKLYQQAMKKNVLTMPVMDLIANLACADKQQRDDAYENMRLGIDICDALDAEIVHVAGCSLAEGVTPEDGRKWIAEGLSEFVDDVENRGMVLAFEDFDPSPTLICSATDCLDILKQSDSRVKFVFDTGNFEAAGEHAEDNFEQMIDHTCHFHFKDFKADDSPRGYSGTYFGQGMIKNREIAQAIKKFNYSGWVALESYRQDGNGPRETIAEEVKVLKSMFE